MTDTRNWKCFFGMHQWNKMGEYTKSYFQYQNSEHPYRIAVCYRLQCVHCGKITHKEF